MRIPRRDKRELQAGITLVELLVSMIIMTLVSTMLIMGWLSLQRSFAFAQRTNTARATARDALDRISSEVRDAQPPAGTSPLTPFTIANPSLVCDSYQCIFYSSYNQPGARGDGSGNKATGTGAVLLKTRIFLDLSVSSAQKTLYWQRDTNNDGTFAPIGPSSPDTWKILASDVVNAPPSSPAIPVFTYLGTGLTTLTVPVSDLSKIVAVQVELAIDSNPSKSPKYVYLKTTVRPRNTAAH
jgi:type II secretory pathway pseudopilin PulG